MKLDPPEGGADARLPYTNVSGLQYILNQM